MLVTRDIGTSAKPIVPQIGPVATTGASVPTSSITVPAEEKEWAALLASEREAAKKRIKPGAVDKAIRDLRYGR